MLKLYKRESDETKMIAEKAKMWRCQIRIEDEEQCLETPWSLVFPREHKKSLQPPLALDLQGAKTYTWNRILNSSVGMRIIPHWFQVAMKASKTDWIWTCHVSELKCVTVEEWTCPPPEDRTEGSASAQSPLNGQLSSSGKIVSPDILLPWNVQGW